MFCPIGDRNEKRVKPVARPLTTPPLVLFRNWHCEWERGSLPLGFQVHPDAPSVSFDQGAGSC